MRVIYGFRESVGEFFWVIMHFLAYKYFKARKTKYVEPAQKMIKRLLWIFKRIEIYLKHTNKYTANYHSLILSRKQKISPNHKCKTLKIKPLKNVTGVLHLKSIIFILFSKPCYFIQLPIKTPESLL
jgi:hypothetical protein